MGVAMGDNELVAPSEKTRKADELLVEASEVARAALIDSVGHDGNGAHLGVVAEADRVVTHFFAATSPGYTGWRWAVTMTRAPRQKVSTVNEVVLLPGDEALVAPEWLPWKDRLGKEDLGPGDLVPVGDDDPRLVPGYLAGDEALDGTSARELREVVREVGLGRERVLSVQGRDEAAERWYAGPHGPSAEIAQVAPARCLSCGFLVRIGGPLTTAFGACANASSPSDGRVVSLDHGCGAHSDVRIEQSPSQAAATPVHDTVTWDTWSDSDLEILSR